MLNNIYFLLMFEIILLFFSFVISKRDIMAPSVMMCIMFSISTLFAILNISKWDITYEWNSVMILTSGILMFIIFSSGSELFHSSRKKLSNTFYNSETENHELLDIRTSVLLMFAIYNVAIIVWYFLKIRSAVGSFSGSIANIFISYRKMGINNLAGSANNEMVGGIINQFLKFTIASGYASVYIMIYQKIFDLERKKKNNILLLFITLSSLMPSLMIASRSNILKFCSAAMVEFYILWNQKYFWRRNVSLKFIAYGVIGLLIGIPVFYYSLTLIGREASQGLMDYTSEYVGSSIQLFDMYIKNPTSATQFGEETLVGIRKVLSILGVGNESLSSNLEFRNYGNGISNVYTFFRRPLHDFGLMGMYIFTSIIAVIFGGIYYKHVRNKIYSHKWNYWVLIYGYLYYWIISSSILQYSGSYISIGTLMYLVIIIICFDLMTRRKVKLIVKR